MATLAGIEALTFDCYGTLIDWNGGVRGAASRAPSLAGIDLERFVRDRDAADRELIQGPFRPYAEVLALSASRAASSQGRTLSDTEARAFAASQRTWPPFAESPAALARLARRFRLAILSNVDADVLACSAALLGARFELLLTAGEIRSYKPRPDHWRHALARLGLATPAVLHVGCSLFHDIRPATGLGFRTAFVNRERESLAPGDAPTLEVPDLETLCRELGV